MQCKDQLQTVFEFLETPKRIVSLVPSQTELLIDLGLRKQLVGITKFCTHPSFLKKEKTIVGGTKKVNLKTIKALQPDIIIGNKEENTKEIIMSCSKIAPVWVSDIYSISDTLEMIFVLGSIFQKETFASQIIDTITSQLDTFKDFMDKRPSKKVAYLIWQKPFMVSGRHTFINDLLKVNKFETIIESHISSYQEMSIDIFKLQTLISFRHALFLFHEKHVETLGNITKKQVMLVDGTYFSWYGSRLQHAFRYFKTLH